MSKKSVKLYTEDVITCFYEAVRTNTLDKLHIPHSEVFYVRNAIEARTGQKYTLKRIEDAMIAEGWLEKEEED